MRFVNGRKTNPNASLIRNSKQKKPAPEDPGAGSTILHTALLAVTLLEAIDAATGIQHFVLPGVERM